MKIMLEFMETVLLQEVNRKPVVIEANGWQRIYTKLEEAGLIVKTITGFNLKEVSAINYRNKYAGAVGGDISAMAWQITETGKRVLRNSLPLHSHGDMYGTRSDF